jgi:hypothetical protein
MVRYFFHTDNGDPRHDADGVELPTGQAPCLEATRLLGELLADRPEDFWMSRSLTLTVTDAVGHVELVLKASVVAGPRATQNGKSPP